MANNPNVEYYGNFGEPIYREPVQVANVANAGNAVNVANAAPLPPLNVSELPKETIGKRDYIPVSFYELEPNMTYFAKMQYMTPNGPLLQDLVFSTAAPAEITRTYVRPIMRASRQFKRIIDVKVLRAHGINAFASTHNGKYIGLLKFTSVVGDSSPATIKAFNTLKLALDDKCNLIPDIWYAQDDYLMEMPIDKNVITRTFGIDGDGYVFLKRREGGGRRRTRRGQRRPIL